MAKKITDLSLIAAIVEELNIPGDDGIQTYRFTVAQLVSYLFSTGRVTLSMLNTSIFNGLTAVTAAADDYLILNDTSDANKTKKALMETFYNPTGSIIHFGGSTAPTGWLLCQGQAVSRTTYASLFAVVGTSFGNGDNSSTFNLPDFRYKVARGFGPNTSILGTGSASSNNATFTAHGFTKTGIQVRKASGTLSGLAADTDYYVIVIDANTLAFSTTKANALAGTKIAITGANSAVITQSEAPDITGRTVNNAGGATGANLGSEEADAFQGHAHIFNNQTNTAGGGGGARLASGVGITTGTPDTLAPYGVARVSNETRMKNIFVNFIIKT